MGILHKFFAKFVYNENTNPLPLAILFTLSLSIFFDAVTEFSGFAYFPQLVKSFNISEVETGKYAGILGSTLFVSRGIAGPIFGYLGDTIGKKRTLMIALVGTMITTCLFGFVKSYSFSVICRTMQGLFTCIVVLGKSMMCEITDHTNEAFAWPFIASSFIMGTMIGPSIGGFAAFPVAQYPNSFARGGFFEKYPAFFPNIINTLGLAGCLTLVMFVIPQHLFGKKTKRINIIDNAEESEKKHEDFVYCSIKGEHSPLIPTKLSGGLVHRFKQTNLYHTSRSPGFMVLNLVFFVYCLTSNGFFDIFPVYVTTNKKYNGLEMTSFDIGLMFLISEPPRLIYTWFIFGKILYKFGSKKTAVVSIFMGGISIALYPFIGLITQRWLVWLLIIVNRLWTGICLTNTLASLSKAVNGLVHPKYHGLAQGIATSVSSFGRAIGPTAFGNIYSWSLTNVKSVTGQEHGLGFPFNQFFPFLLTMVLCWMVAVFAHWALVSQPAGATIQVNDDGDKQKRSIYVSYVTL